MNTLLFITLLFVTCICLPAPYQLIVADLLKDSNIKDPHGQITILENIYKEFVRALQGSNLEQAKSLYSSFAFFVFHLESHWSSNLSNSTFSASEVILGLLKADMEESVSCKNVFLNRDNWSSRNSNFEDAISFLKKEMDHLDKIDILPYYGCLHYRIQSLIRLLDYMILNMYIDDKIKIQHLTTVMMDLFSRAHSAIKFKIMNTVQTYYMHTQESYCTEIFNQAVPLTVDLWGVQDIMSVVDGKMSFKQVIEQHKPTSSSTVLYEPIAKKLSLFEYEKTFKDSPLLLPILIVNEHNIGRIGSKDQFLTLKNALYLNYLMRMAMTEYFSLSRYNEHLHYMNEIQTYLHSNSSFDKMSIRGRFITNQTVSHLHQHERFVKILSKANRFYYIEKTSVNPKELLNNSLKQIEVSKALYGTGAIYFQTMINAFANDYITANTWKFLKPSDSNEIGEKFNRTTNGK